MILSLKLPAIRRMVERGNHDGKWYRIWIRPLGALPTIGADRERSDRNPLVSGSWLKELT
jgi:hypothetical protein